MTIEEMDKLTETDLQELKKLLDDVGQTLDFQEMSAYRHGKEHIRKLKGRVYEMQTKLDKCRLI